jgi:hypothetical protein
LTSLEWAACAIACLCLITTVGELVRPVPPIDDTAAIPATSTTAQAGSEPSTIGTKLRNYEIITSRPLFTVDRKPYRIPVRETLPAPVIERRERHREPTVSFTLSGVIRTPGTSVALLAKNGDDGTHRLHTGESLDGWTLREIRDDRVRMQNGRSELLVLLKPETDTTHQ